MEPEPVPTASSRSILSLKLPTMFYVFHGKDAHSQKETLDSLLGKLGDPGLLDLNTTRFEGLLRFGDLRQACDALPFLAPARVVIVRNLFAAKPDKAFMDELVAYLPQLPETARLVFMESDALRDSQRVLKLAESAPNGFAKRFDPLQGGELERWIQERAAAKHGRIAPRAAHLLAINVGSELQILDNELEKLVLYRGEGQTIEAEDVTLLSPYLAEANIFDLVDAIGNRNGRKAATLLHEKLAEGEDPFRIFPMIIRQFRLLIQVKELADDGLNPPAIAKAIRQHSFVVGKLYAQARGFSMAQLEQIYRHLLAIDVDVKTGKADMLTALNLLVASLTVTA